MDRTHTNQLHNRAERYIRARSGYMTLITRWKRFGVCRYGRVDKLFDQANDRIAFRCRGVGLPAVKESV